MPNEQVKKAVGWLIKSGALLTALNASSVLLSSLQTGDINIQAFGQGLLYTFAFMFINATIYYIHEVNNG